MTKPLSRRSFLRAAAAAPVAAKSGALQALTAAVENGLTLAQAGVAIAPDIPTSWGIHALSNKKLYALFKMGMLPEWVRQDVDENILQNTGGRLSPDVAALRSVSLSAKFCIQRQRHRARIWNDVDRFHINEVARRAFWDEENPDAKKPPPPPR